MAADIFALANQASKVAHAPYSGFQVGAAIRTRDGRIFSGCNVENVSYPEGWCAETTAISQMIMDGGGEIVEVAVYSPQKDAITPCGGCRQRLAEFGTAQTKVHLCDQNGIAETVNLGQLLPRAFEF